MVALGVWLMLAPGGDAVAAEPVADVEEQARAAYDADRYEEAAASYEALWAEHHRPKFLYNAGLAREGLGHRAHALSLWSMYLGLPELSAEERARALAKVASVQARTTAVAVQVFPVALAEKKAILEVRYTGPVGPAEHAPLRLPLATLVRNAAGGRAVYLEPGTWALQVELAGEMAAAYAAKAQTITVTTGQTTANVVIGLAPTMSTLEISASPASAAASGFRVRFHDELEIEKDQQVVTKAASTRYGLRAGPWSYEARNGKAQPVTGRLALVPEGSSLEIEFASGEWVRADPAVRRARLGLGIGLGTAAIVSATVGGVLLDRGEKDFDKLDKTMVLANKKAFSVANDVSCTGAGLLGASVGLLVGSVTGAVKPEGRRAWIVELAVGAAATAGGLAWFGWGVDRYYREAKDNGAPSLRMHSIASAGVSGLGGGVVVSAVTGLITARRLRPRNAQRLSVVPSAGRGKIAVVVQMQF